MPVNLDSVQKVGRSYDKEESAENFFESRSPNKHRMLRLKKESQFVEGLNIKDKIVLDIGCSGGKYSHMLMKHNTVYAIDLSKKALQYARSMSPNVSFIQASATHLPFKESFTCILFIELMHHLDQQLLDCAMNEIMRVTKPDGTLICDLRNSLNPIMWYSFKKRDGKHFPLKTRSLFWLEKRLKELRFSVVHKVGLFIPISFIAPYVMCIAKKKLVKKK